MKTPSWFLHRSLKAWALLPFSILYYIGHRIVFWSKSKNMERVNIPIICVGNIFAGGVGKTPIVRAISKYVYGSAVVACGYRAKISGRVEQYHTADEASDEAKMLSSTLSVFVGRSKKEAAKMAKNCGAKVIVMDDGFQNPGLYKDVSILVFDGNMGLGNGFMLPAGPLREPLSDGISRADAVIIVGRDRHGLKKQIQRIKKIPVFMGAPKLDDPGLSGAVVAFAGIGYPNKFFRALDSKKINSLTTRGFPDHHLFKDSELLSLEMVAKEQGAELVTTEKDWVRLSPEWQSRITMVPMEMILEDKFYIWLDDRILK